MSHSAVLSFVDGTNWKAFIIGEDESGRSSVRLCGVQSGRHFCVNDLLVQNEYAAVVGSRQCSMLMLTC